MPGEKERKVVKTSWENRKLVWGLVAIALATSAVGSIFDLYDSFWWFDKALHAYTMFAYTLALGLFAYGAVLTGAHNQRLFLILAIGSLGLALGVLWEVFEWVYDQFVRPNVILGKTDTVLDLVADALGSLAVGYVCSRMLGK